MQTPAEWMAHSASTGPLLPGHIYPDHVLWRLVKMRSAKGRIWFSTATPMSAVTAVFKASYPLGIV